jgi:hypothetical protein
MLDLKPEGYALPEYGQLYMVGVWSDGFLHLHRAATFTC